MTPDKQMLVAGGYQHIRLYDMVANTPVVNFEGVAKNITRVGFQEVSQIIELFLTLGNVFVRNIVLY